MLNEIDQLLIEDEMALLDEQDTMILLEEENKTVPLDLKERILQGEYL